MKYSFIEFFGFLFAGIVCVLVSVIMNPVLGLLLMLGAALVLLYIPNSEKNLDR